MISWRSISIGGAATAFGAFLWASPFLAPPTGPGTAPPPASGSAGREADLANLERSFKEYEACLKEIGVLVRELDRLMEHRDPCPECTKGGGGRDHPHAIAASWKPGGAEAPKKVQAKWDEIFSQFARQLEKLKRARDRYLEFVGKLGMNAPRDTSAQKLRMELHSKILAQFREALSKLSLEKYSESFKEIQANIAPDEVTKATVPVPKPPKPKDVPAAPIPSAPPSTPPSAPAPSAPQPKTPSPEEIARKRKVLSDAIRKHDEAIGRLRGLVSRFDELMNHRKDCPACKGGNNDRNHEHAVHRTWRKTGGPLPDPVRLESTRVQRDIGQAISEAQKSTKVAEKLVDELGPDAPADALASLRRMQARSTALENYDRTLDRNQHASYDAALGALRGVL